MGCARAGDLSRCLRAHVCRLGLCEVRIVQQVEAPPGRCQVRGSEPVRCQRPCRIACGVEDPRNAARYAVYTVTRCRPLQGH